MEKRTRSTPPRRVDFPVPAGSERARCRYCGQEIVWAPVASLDRPGDARPHPIDARSLLRVEGETRGESHFAYCSGAREARRGPTSLCRVRECGAEIPRGRFYCRRCWREVPDALQQALLAEHREHGATRHLLELVRHAAQIVEQRRRARAAKQGELFESAPRAELDL